MFVIIIFINLLLFHLCNRDKQYIYSICDTFGYHTQGRKEGETFFLIFVGKTKKGGK